MIKIICLGVCAMSMIALYKVPVPDAATAREARVRSEDRLFLAELATKEAAGASDEEPAVRGFGNEAHREAGADIVPVAKAVAVRPPRDSGERRPVDDGLPVRRAVPVDRAAGSTIAVSAPTNASTVTRITPMGSEMPRTKGRASILIYRDEVIVRPALPTP